jgi:hypothetical protein
MEPGLAQRRALDDAAGDQQATATGADELGRQARRARRAKAGSPSSATACLPLQLELRTGCSYSAGRAAQPISAHPLPHVLTCASPDEFAEVTASRARSRRSSVGIVPESRLDAIAVAESEIEFTDGRTSVGLGESVTLIPPESAKGLEFDAVIVVEPAAIAAVGDHGLRLLYIALTRAVRTLTLIHTERLPAPLRSSGSQSQ